MLQQILASKTRVRELIIKLILGISTIIHLYYLYGFIFIAPGAGGAKDFMDMVKLLTAKVGRLGTATFISIEGARLLMFVIPIIALVVSEMLMLRQKYSLAAQFSVGLLMVMICCIALANGAWLKAIFLFCFFGCLLSISRALKPQEAIARESEK